MPVETPHYEVVDRRGDLEIRRYDPYVRATVRVSADEYDEATSRGFGLLADYIFGNNRDRGSIAMTAPVTSEREHGSRIAMTAPVTSERDRADHMAQAEPLCTVRCPGVYTVSFTMPSQYRTAEKLPEPMRPEVELESVPAHLAAVARFSGRLGDEAFARHREELQTWIAENGYVAVGEPVAAQYDAPWKPGFARRNEVIVPIEEHAR